MENENNTSMALWKKITIVTLCLLVGGTAYAYSYPDISIEEQKRVTEIEGQILDHKGVILDNEQAIEKLKNEKEEIENSKKKLFI